MVVCPGCLGRGVSGMGGMLRPRSGHVLPLAAASGQGRRSRPRFIPKTLWNITALEGKKKAPVLIAVSPGQISTKRTCQDDQNYRRCGL